MPTREVHYFRRPRDQDPDGHGMVLLYMDRPSTEFWRTYVTDPHRHDRAEVDQNGRIVDAFALFVARDVKRSLESSSSQGDEVRLTEQARRLFQQMSLAEATAHVRQSIVTYGIRDWARAPYGAANHGWQPGVRSWKVMDAFSAFDFGSGARNLHIVGEAYSRGRAQQRGAGAAHDCAAGRGRRRQRGGGAVLSVNADGWWPVTPKRSPGRTSAMRR
jgi:hypothetical protein